MRFEKALIPVRASWSSPFVRWQGGTADLNSLELARQVAEKALRDGGVEWPVRELVLGWTIPQKEAFYGAPALAAQLGFSDVGGPMVSQACATSVAALNAAASSQDDETMGARLVVTTDRTSNGPHLTYPVSSSPGGTPDSENWVLDSFARDPITGESMLATAERVAREGGFSKAELDDLTVRRYEQYADSLADDRAFQRRWMVPITVGTGKRSREIDADEGVRPIVAEELRSLKAVTPEGVVSYGTQTHPADGTAGFVVTTEQQAKELGVDGPLARIRATGFCRVGAGTMPKAPVPAAKLALDAAQVTLSDVDVIKSHNPFVVNDLWFARETGVDAGSLNPYGCSLIYGHPQGPTGARGIVELLHALEERGGGLGLFTGCAAGDTGAAVVLELAD